MFWVWFEDLVVMSNLECTNLSRAMLYNRVGSIFFHSDNYMRFSYYLDGWC